MKIFMTIVTYVLYFFFYSAVGWLGESIYCSVGARKWVNRGFLKGPMCPIYGTGALAMAITGAGVTVGMNPFNLSNTLTERSTGHNTNAKVKRIHSHG